jgi:putative ABC transport system permease protein
LCWIVTGLALGLGSAFIVSKALPGMIYGVSGSDPVTCLAVILLLGGTAYTASWIPARRASRTDPLAALREE